MPYFSFLLKKKFNFETFDKITINSKKIIPEVKYFSKNTNLWKILCNSKNSDYVGELEYEKRKKIDKLGNSILFCLPPAIGLGDSIEYALAIKSILKSKLFKKIGVAYAGRFKKIFNDYANIDNIYEDIVKETDLKEFDTIFHFTLEIKQLANQKYSREDIEELVTKYFSIEKYRNKIKTKKNIININKLTFFPVSTSPVRSLQPQTLNNIIKFFYNKYKIEVVLDKSSISNYIEENIDLNLIEKKYPSNLDELISLIKTIKFGIFIDSGPLHVAKILGKSGIFISSTVDNTVLLNGFETIFAVQNNYKSPYCKAPCGLTNIFNYNNNIGCYDSLKIKKNKILNLPNFKNLQRGNLKKNYINLMMNPVGCINNIDSKNIINKMNFILNK
tara:strand:- start:1344 stop:2510 length:1167 start_codon:yes stop_codon:yes gene_type:complete